MRSRHASFNPARLTDQIQDSLYASVPGWGPGPRLKRDRKKLIEWLYKKCGDDERSFALADKLETCKPACAKFVPVSQQ
jgi:hypothetical protein